MKHLLLTTIAAVLLVGCGESQSPESPDILIRDAAYFGNIEDVKKHLAAGADVNAEGNGGWTPLDSAILMNEKETADLLRKHGGKTKKELEAAESIHDASRYGNIEAVKQHLANGVDVNAKGDGESTPLHWAAYGGHKETAELLIAEGADVNAESENGVAGGPISVFLVGGIIRKTPLDNAIMRSHTEIADLLRKHGGKRGEELKAEGK